jgi:hypothetical protein
MYAIQRLQESRGREEERGVDSAAGSGDDLAAAAEERRGGERDVCEAEFGVADRLFAEGPFAHAPGEALADGVADCG